MNGVESIISELEQQREAIGRAIEALRQAGGISAGPTPAPAKRRGRPPGRKFSAEARRRMSEAQKRRYADQRGAQAPATKKRGGKRTISAAGRARIAEAARRMWAKRKKAGK